MALATNIYSRGSPHLWTNLFKFPEALDLDLDLKSILDVFIYRCWGSRSLRTSGSDPVTECPGARFGVRWSARMSFCKPGKFSVGNSTLNIITWNYSLDTECVFFDWGNATASNRKSICFWSKAKPLVWHICTEYEGATMVAREAGELLNGSWDGGKPAGDDEDDDFMMMMMMMVMVMLVMLMMTMMVMMMIMMMMMATTTTMTMTMMINHDDEHDDSVCILWQTCSAAVYSMLSRANILQ